jgi:hypothetical protein
MPRDIWPARSAVFWMPPIAIEELLRASTTGPTQPDRSKPPA